jgi:hypothetical protein
MPLIDIKGAAAVLADHLTASGAPVAKELLESGLEKILPALQSDLATGEQTALSNVDALADHILTRINNETIPVLVQSIKAELIGLKITNTTMIEKGESH